MTYDEGVIKFRARHRTRELTHREVGDVVEQLIAWRAILLQTGLVGQDQARYGGAGYGNVSARTGAPASPRGKRSFVVSGTQTGGLPCVSLDEFAWVRTYDIRENSVESEGLLQPSSEAMTHGAIYDLGSHIRFVFHGHCPILWHQATALRLPTTHSEIPYGTPEMAREMERLYRETPLPVTRVLVMGGHEDGVIVFGADPEEAGATLLKALAKAYRMAARKQGGRFCITG